MPFAFHSTQTDVRRKVKVDSKKMRQVYDLSDSEEEDMKPTPHAMASTQALPHGVSLKFELRI